MEFHNRMESPYAGPASVAVYRGGRFKWWRPTWSQLIPQGEAARFKPRWGERRTYSVLVDVRYRIPNPGGADLTYPEKRRLANLRDLGQRIVIEDGDAGRWRHFRLRTCIPPDDAPLAVTNRCQGAPQRAGLSARSKSAFE